MEAWVATIGPRVLMRSEFSVLFIRHAKSEMRSGRDRTNGRWHDRIVGAGDLQEQRETTRLASVRSSHHLERDEFMLRMATLIGFSLLYGGSALALVPAAPSIFVACGADLQKYCKSVEPGGGRLIACLQPHKKQLVPACRTRLETMIAHRAGSPPPPPE
jgi:hypothetical protein